MVFSLACEGLHPDDAYQVESLLVFMVQVSRELHNHSMPLVGTSW
jgi:hypothetical protein